MNRLLLIIGIFCFGLSNIFAQDQNFDTAYKIQLGAYSKDFDKTKYEALMDLGLVIYERSEGMTRVYLGNYLDKKSANKALAKAKDRGFDRVFLVNESVSSTDSKGNLVSHYIQLSALKKFDFSEVSGRMYNNPMSDKTYIFREGDYYKVIVGMYAIDNVGGDIEKLSAVGYEDILVRKMPVVVNEVETVEATFMYGTNAEGEEQYTVRLGNGKDVDLYAYVPVFGLFDLAGNIPMEKGDKKFSMIVDNDGAFVLNPTVKGKKATVTFETIPMDENFYPQYGFHPMVDANTRALNVVKKIEFK